jgi:hypothetical protein
MKKFIFSLVAVVIVIITASLSIQAQKINVTAEKSFGNIGKEYRNQTDAYQLEICPFGQEANFGFYLGSLYRQFDDCGITNGRMTSWAGGFSFNYLSENNLFFKMNLGLRQAIVRFEKLSYDYNDFQENLDFDGLLSIGYYRPEFDFFSRTILTAKGNQPFGVKKRLYYDNQIVALDDSLAANLQNFTLNLEQNLIKFSLNQDWNAALDFNIGYSLEHSMLINDPLAKTSSFVFGGSFSVFGGDYFYQDMIKIYAFNKSGGFQPGAFVGVKLNIVPLIYFLWNKTC